MNEIDLRNNQIQHIRTSDFLGNLKSLSALKLYNNHIEHVHAGAFDDLPELKEGLNLYRNPCTTLPILNDNHFAYLFCTSILYTGTSKALSGTCSTSEGEIPAVHTASGTKYCAFSDTGHGEL